MFLHIVFTHMHDFAHMHACMPNVASYLAINLPFNLNYNATVLVTLFFSLQGLGYIPMGGRRNHGGSGINKPNTVGSY